MGEPLQLNVITSGFTPAKASLGWSTGIRCPRCNAREIVYNGNYFCAGFDGPEPECTWALPSPEDWRYPWHETLAKALIASQRRRVAHQQRFENRRPRNEVPSAGS